jgi:hypothetical protein
MTNPPSERSNASQDSKRSPRASAANTPNSLPTSKPNTALCWPFPAGSQNDTDKAVKLPPYVPPKRRTLNQY